ncbi:MAG: hypothetical protein Ct9H300mP3_08250 [Gammaproteobacteria bacterium]|nr:MAG: hypothetical protein Ct9H300mP3_08250 [Gammaproteobacteria bacterium]
MEIKNEKVYKVVKHALGSFGIEDGYDKKHEDEIAAVRIFIVGSNLVCVWVIIANISKDGYEFHMKLLRLRTE